MMTAIPVVDSREPSDIWYPFVERGWERKALHAGDFSFEDAQGDLVLIERKTIADFIQSMESGRLTRQASDCVEEAKFPILFLEGSWQQRNGRLLGSDITWQQAWNYLQTLQDTGMRLQLTTSLEHTIVRIHELREYYMKGHHLSSQRSRSENPHIAALMQTPGVGYKKAKQLHEAGIKLHLETDIKTLITLPGIGQARAERWVKFWNEE